MLPANHLVKLLEFRAQDSPYEVGAINAGDGQAYHYEILNDDANRVANYLEEVGVRAGDRIVLFAHNHVNLFEIIFGVLKVRASFVPIHPETSPSILKFILKDCAPTVLITELGLLSLVKDLGKTSTWKIVVLPESTHGNLSTGEDFMTWDKLKNYPSHRPEFPIDSRRNDMVGIIYTSGSTKEPRGVVLHDHQVMFATKAINSVLRNSANDVILCGLPLSFDYGLYQIFLALQSGAKLVLQRDFKFPLSIPRVLQEYKITGFPAVPSIFALLLRSRLLERVDIPSLRYITSTGDIFPVAHIKQLETLLPNVTIFPMYGLTECKRVSIVPEGRLKDHESSVGIPLPGTNVSIADESGEEVAIGEVGELIVTGGHVMKGYWNDVSETEKRFRKDPLTGEVSLYTGDYFRRDVDGFLYFMGRGDAFIKSRGEKISLAEIEAFLCTIDGVAEAAVIGIPDPILGASVCAFVSGYSSKKLDRVVIIKECITGLRPAARPGKVVVLREALPKTENGKIDRKKLHSMFINNQLM